MAPSPTGMFHIGSLRTALYDYLLAKHEGGIFMLRVEDTDQSRFVDGALENMLSSLYWANVIPDEGVVFDESQHVTQKGNNGPYIQSERLAIYEQYIQQLLDNDYAYYAFDTAEELEDMRNRQRLNKQAPRYARSEMKNSFTLGMEKAKELIAAGEEYVVRMIVPENEELVFTDLVRGVIRVNTNEVDEQILRKSDGFPTYHLAVVVDDNAMETTHVLRGEEWISSTPKHLLLYRYFGWKEPLFGHLPVIINETGKKLSKRHGDVSVSSFQEKGYLPEAVLNFLVLLGWNPGTEQELFTLEEMVASFDMSKVQKKPAVFDRVKLDWFNQQWIRKIDEMDLLERCLPYLEQSDLLIAQGNGTWDTKNGTSVDKSFLLQVVLLQKDRMVVLGDIVEAIRFVFDLPEYEASLLVWKKSDAVGAMKMLTLLKEQLMAISVDNWTAQGINDVIFPWIKEHEYGVGDVLWPLRVALSGQQYSPGPFDIAAVLGKEEVLKRTDVALAMLA